MRGLTEQRPHGEDTPANSGRGCLGTPRSQKLVDGSQNSWHSELPISEATYGSLLAPPRRG
jgi:hypothetical protein